MLRIFVFFVASLSGAVTVSTARYDNTRDGQNTQETILTPANVANIVNLGSYSVDGAVWAQPLYAPSVTISSTVYNVLIVATANNTVYAFNADQPGSSYLWKTHIAGTLWTTSFGVLYALPIGILSTPVIDVPNGNIYVVTCTSSPVAYTLQQIGITTGSVTGSATIGGTSQGVTFTATYELQRACLTLENGNVYIGFGAGNEPFTWYGWLFAYATSNLSQVAIWNAAPSIGAGIWEPGGPAVDGSGNIYALTGNGAWDGTSNYSQSVVKLSSTLSVLDYFTPANESSTSAADADVASGTAMLIPGTNFLTFGSKDGRAWVINTTTGQMGELQGSGTLPQVFTIQSITPGGGTGVYGGLFCGGSAYFPMAGLPTFAYAFSGSTFNTTPFAQTSLSYSQVSMGCSSNAGTNAIIWALTVSQGAAVTPRQVTLHAWNPTNLQEYWTSGTTIGEYSKMTMPVVANGRVYVPTIDSGVQTFGIAPSSAVSRGAGAIRGATTMR